MAYKETNSYVADVIAKRKYLATMALTSSQSWLSLPSTFPDGTPVPKQPLLAVQPDQDCNWEVAKATNAALSLTNSAWIQQAQFDYQTLSATDMGVNAMTRTGTGNLLIFVLDRSNL